MKNVIILFALVFLLNSCTTEVFMTRTVPAELVLEKQPARIVVNNHYDYQTDLEIKEKHQTAYKTGIEEFVKSLVDITPPDNNMTVFLYDTTRHYQNTDLTDTLMIKNEIISLCEANRADFLLSIDNLSLYFDWEVFREEDIEGSVSKTKNFDLFCEYYLTLYDLNGLVKQRTLLEKSCHYSSRPTLTSLITIKPNLANAKRKIQKLANDAGLEYFSLFYPTIEKNERQLYTGKVFQETNSLIKFRQYNEAITLIQEMINTLDPKLAAKAQHNLDVAKELKQNSINISMTD